MEGEETMSKGVSNAMQVGKIRVFAVTLAVMVAVTLLITMTNASLAATAPAAPVISSPTEGSFVTGAFTLSGTAPTDSVVHVYNPSTEAYMGNARVDASGNWGLALSGLDDGKTSFTARASKDGVSSAWSNFRTVTVDTRAPANPSITSPTEGSRLLKDVCDRYKFSGTAEPGSKVELFEGPTPKGTVKANLSGNWAMSVYLYDLRTYYFRARATDIAGNVSGWSETRTIRVVPNFDTSKGDQPPDCSY
jgi:hypothetical protein